MTEFLAFLSSLDGNLLLWIQEHLRSEFFTPLWSFITTSGNGGLIWIAIACFLLAFKKTRKVGIMSVVALVFSLVFTNLLIKPLVARTRPYDVMDGIILLIEKPREFSFPSGHTCAAFAAAWVMFRSLPKKFGVPAVIYASLMAFSRLYFGVHYPTDVLAGMIFGILYAQAAMWIIERFRPDSPGAEKR